MNYVIIADFLHPCQLHSLCISVDLILAKSNRKHIYNICIQYNMRTTFILFRFTFQQCNSRAQCLFKMHLHLTVMSLSIYRLSKSEFNFNFSFQKDHYRFVEARPHFFFFFIHISPSNSRNLWKSLCELNIPICCCFFFCII